MPLRYDLELLEVQREVVTMGALAGDMVRLAVRSALERDTVLAAEVVEMDDDLDRREFEATQHVITTILRESPVGRDLLYLIGALGIFGEIEKVGDDATKLARRVGKLRGEFPSELKVALSDMDRRARQNFAAAIHLVINYDAVQAAELIAADDVVDLAYKDSRDLVLDLMRENPANLRQLVRSADVFRALEHVSDRAVDIAKRLKRFHDRRPLDAQFLPMGPAGGSAESP